MKKVNIHVKTQKLLADTPTPMGLYLNLRDRFSQAFLLESSDYHGNDNNYSFVCLDPIASFVLGNDTVQAADGATYKGGHAVPAFYGYFRVNYLFQRIKPFSIKAWCKA